MLSLIAASPHLHVRLTRTPRAASACGEADEADGVQEVGLAAAETNWRGLVNSLAGGLLTDVDAMVALTKPEYSGPGSWADADSEQPTPAIPSLACACSCS
mgnify:CR=1 FL=1